jgi:hypothetical protein
MKTRTTSVLLGLLYLVVATTFGFLPHDHDAPGAHHDCAACVWRVTGLTDAPVQVTVVMTVPVAQPVHPPTLSPVLSNFRSPTAARAPPALMA